MLEGCIGCPLHYLLSLLHQVGRPRSWLLLEVLVQVGNLVQGLFDGLLGGLGSRLCGAQYCLRPMWNSI